MNAKGQREVTVCAYALVAALVLCCGVAVFNRGCGRTDSAATGAGRNGASASEQVTRATELNELAGAENKSAGAAVDRATSNAEGAAELNQRATEQLAGSKELLSEIRADNQRAKQILSELIADHQAGHKADKKN